MLADSSFHQYTVQGLAAFQAWTGLNGTFASQALSAMDDQQSLANPSDGAMDFVYELDDFEKDLQLYASPMDPSIYSKIYPETPHPKIAEIAGLMTDLYNLFVEMIYINAEHIALPPHTSKPINIAVAAQFGLTKDVVDIMQMLPYYTGDVNWNHGSDHNELLHWGEFGSDLRGNDVDWIEQVIDPYYALDYAKVHPSGRERLQGWDEEDGVYMRPWYLPLNDMGNHGSLMVLNTRDFHMWFVDQMGGVMDPALEHLPTKETTNRNDMEQYPNRPATEFLRDIIERFRSLEYIPGGLYDEQQQEYSDFKRMYVSAGWPDNFDKATFDRLREEREQAQQDRGKAEEPLNQLKKYLMWGKMREDHEKYHHEALAELQALPAEAAPDKRRELEERMENSGKRVTPEAFAEQQEETKRVLEEQESELQKLLEDNKDLDWDSLDWREDRAAHDRHRYEGSIKTLQAYLQDESWEARDERQIREARMESEKVDPVIKKGWEERVEKYGY